MTDVKQPEIAPGAVLTGGNLGNVSDMEKKAAAILPPKAPLIAPQPETVPETVVPRSKVSFGEATDLGQLGLALSKAQAAMKFALKDTTGQIGQQKTKYADLTSVWEACREALTANELSVIQSPSAEGPRVTVQTILIHSSGQYVTGELTMTAGVNTPQAIGSAITYARRYALASMVGVAPDDDDGTAASKK